MWTLAAAALTVLGLVRFAATRPERRRASRARKLAYLSRLAPSQLTLDQAEDGAVLAREAGDQRTEVHFKQAAASLKKARVP